MPTRRRESPLPCVNGPDGEPTIDSIAIEPVVRLLVVRWPADAGVIDVAAVAHTIATHSVTAFRNVRTRCCPPDDAANSEHQVWRSAERSPKQPY